MLCYDSKKQQQQQLISFIDTVRISIDYRRCSARESCIKNNPEQVGTLSPKLKMDLKSLFPSFGTFEFRILS